MSEDFVFGVLAFGMVNLAIVGGITAQILRTVSRQRAEERVLQMRLAQWRREERV